jgi:hypothetical protein
MAAPTPLPNDTNLSPGLTYTFTFDLDNWFTMPSTATILQDIQSQAPDFLSSVSASWASGLGPLTNYLNVTFTYSGDGSDVVSDVANELIAAFTAGSNDSFDFVQATGGTAGLTAVTSVQTAAQTAGTAVGSAVGTAVASTVQSATSSAASNLGTSGWVFVVLGVIALLAFFSMETGIRE